MRVLGLFVASLNAQSICQTNCEDEKKDEKQGLQQLGKTEQQKYLEMERKGLKGIQ